METLLHLSLGDQTFLMAQKNSLGLIIFLKVAIASIVVVSIFGLFASAYGIFTSSADENKRTLHYL